MLILVLWTDGLATLPTNTLVEQSSGHPDRGHGWQTRLRL